MSKKPKLVDERRRSWAELDSDCLSNVFANVGMESLILDVPFVCKSWYKATLSPICWSTLFFPDYLPLPLFTGNDEDDNGPQSFGPFYDRFVNENGIDIARFNITAFVKLVVDRSNGMADSLQLPEFCTEEALRYVSDKCPLLVFVWLPDDLVLFKHSQIIPEVIGKWKLLRQLILGSCLVKIVRQIEIQHESRLSRVSKHFKVLLTPRNPTSVLDRIIEQVGTHCKYLNNLMIFDARVGEVETSTIVNLLPKLQTLSVRHCRVERESAVALLRGCKELMFFYADLCEGLEKTDEEISKLACRIRNFTCNRCAGGDVDVIRLFGNVRKLIFKMLGSE